MSINRTLLGALFLLASVSLTGTASAAADPTLNEVYQAAQSGHLRQAEAMMDQVLKDHPNSAKAHFVEAELLSKQGRVDLAKAELGTAERLAPGLGFAKPEAVRELKARLATPSAPSAFSPAVRPAVAPAHDFPWGFLLVGGLLVAAFAFFIRSAMQRRVAPAYGGYGVPAAYGPGAAGTYGAAGPGPMAPMGGMGAAGGGIGSGMLGGLATGVAVGAGVVAGEALMHRVLGGGDPQRAGAQQPFQSFDDAAGLPNSDMGGADFGIADGGSWDDASSGGGGDDWG